MYFALQSHTTAAARRDAPTSTPTHGHFHMPGWLRKIRGALGLGVVFGATWGAAGGLLALVLYLTTGSIQADVPFPVGFGILGFLAGTTFGGILGLLEGNRRFEQMSIPRFAGWGAAGGALFAAVFTTFAATIGGEGTGFFRVLPMLMGVFGAGGALCASGALAIARRSAGDAGRLESDDDHPRLEP